MRTPKKVKQITVFIGLVVHKNKILLTKRNESELKDAHLKWEFPGGKVDYGETPQEAVAREIEEETGVKVKVGRLLPYIHTVNWEYPWGTQHTIIFGFECKYVSEKKREQDHHVDSIAWVPLNEYLSLETLPGGKEFFESLGRK